MTTLSCEQERTRTYLHEKGTALSAAALRERVGAALAALERQLDGVREEEARRSPGPEGWSVQEVVDHLVASYPPGIEELRDLLAGRRPGGEPIPAGLQSPAPGGRRWSELVDDLRMLQRAVMATLAAADDSTLLDARAAVVMVINTRDAAGVERPVQWIEELDWKAYAAVLRLHALDHLGQIRRTLQAVRAGR